MNIKAFYSSYVRQVFVVWDIPDDACNHYELWRDNEKIAEMDYLAKDIPGNHSEPTEEIPFVNPCMFDRDHHTHLFFKDSSHQLMYVDTDIQNFTEHSYYVIANVIDEDDTILASFSTNKSYVTIGD